MENEQDQVIDVTETDTENPDEVMEEIVAEEEASAEELNQLLEDAKNKADEHWNQLMRARAELDNLKKRHDRDLENAHKYGLEKFINELLMVWDSLQLGESAAREDSANVEKLREGTALTLKLMTDVMGKFGVTLVDPEGDSFDPELHQAIATVPRDDIEPDLVVAVVQKGYLLNGRLIRPAMVTVSQAPPK